MRAFSFQEQTSGHEGVTAACVRRKERWAPELIRWSASPSFLIKGKEQQDLGEFDSFQCITQVDHHLGRVAWACHRVIGLESVPDVCHSQRSGEQVVELQEHVICGAVVNGRQSICAICSASSGTDSRLWNGDSRKAAEGT